MKHLILSLIILLLSSSTVFSQLTNENLPDIISAAKSNKLKFKVKYKNKKIITYGIFHSIEEQHFSSSIDKYLMGLKAGKENWIVTMESGQYVNWSRTQFFTQKIICLMNEDNIMKAIDFIPGTKMIMEGKIEKTGYFIDYKRDDPEHILLKFGSCEITDFQKEMDKFNKHD